jgi:hypothetical protein
MFSDVPVDMNQDQFNAYMNDPASPKVVMSISALGDIKAELEQLCSYYSGGCSTPEMKALRSFVERPIK